MSNALLVEEPEPTLVRHLTSDGFRLVDEETRPDLVLLADPTALDELGSRHGDVLVIVLGDPEAVAVDRVRALARGCDDSVARPFVYVALLARLRVVLRPPALPAPDLLVARP